MNRVVAILLASLVGALVLSVALGSVPLPLDRVLGALTFQSSQGDQLVVWQIRLPRALAAGFVGAALGMSGAALQGLLRNPLAEPGILGVSATAALFATFVLYFGLATAGPLVLPLAAVAGALIATLLVALAAIRTRSVVTLILIGVGLSSFSAAIMALLMNLAPNPFSLADMVNWMLGTVDNRSFDDLLCALPFMAIGVAVLLASRRGLSALALGDEAAEGMGLDLKRQRLAVIIGAGLATGAAVALAGAIGFVGIVAPHLVRPFLRYDPARLLVPSALLRADPRVRRYRRARAADR